MHSRAVTPVHEPSPKTTSQFCSRIDWRETYASYPQQGTGVPKQVPESVVFRSIHVRHGASSRPAWVAAGTACSNWARRCRSTLCRNREDREFRCQALAMALWAGGLVVSEDERFELMVARLAQVFEDGHGLSLRCWLELSIRAENGFYSRHPIQFFAWKTYFELSELSIPTTPKMKSALLQQGAFSLAQRG